VFRYSGVLRAGRGRIHRITVVIVVPQKLSTRVTHLVPPRRVHDDAPNTHAEGSLVPFEAHGFHKTSNYGACQQGR
jgi:hypothetical protein